MKNLSKTSSLMLPFSVIIYGWLEIKLEWRVPKVIQLIFPGKFLKSSWSIKKLGMSKMRDHPKDVVWSPPPKSWIKLNFDAVIHEEKTTVAVVGRDIVGNLLLAWLEQFESGNSLLGEARVAWCAMRCAMNEGFKNIILEGDAWNVIEPLKKSDVAPHWSIRSIFENILYFANCFSNVEFSFVHRKGNISAHLLA